MARQRKSDSIRYGWAVVWLMMISYLWGGAAAWAQFQPPANGNFIPPIPNFGDGNPLDRFIGQRNAGELAELRKVRVTPREEQEYGDRVLQTMRDDLKRRNIELVTRGTDVDYVKRLVDAIRPSMANHDRYKSVRVLVAQTDLTDAYSIPGGTIIMYRGMIDGAGSEAALVGVVGHELSHLDHGHQLLPIQRTKFMQQTPRDVGRMDFDQFFRQTSVFMSAYARPFRPEDETEADRDGATWAYRAGYDPRVMSELFARMNQRDQVGQFMPAFLRTHPYNADRQAAVEKVYQELRGVDPTGELYVGRENLRRRIPMSVRRFE